MYFKVTIVVWSSVYWWVKVREIIIKKKTYIVEIGEGERRVPREDFITGGNIYL